MNTEQSVVIIILNNNKKDDLLECLESISKLEYKNYQIVIVDNGSNDGSVEAIKTRYPEIHLVLSNINLGVAGGRNTGIDYAKKKLNYDFLLFLDNDIIIEARTLTEMVNSFNLNQSIGIVTPKCYMLTCTGIFGYAGGMHVNLFTGKIQNIGGGEKDTGQYDKPGFIDSSGGLCLFKKEMINKVGVFDETFNPYGWEDVDYSLRAKKNGYKIFYNPKAIIYHKGGKKGRGKAIREYEFSKSKNYIYLIKKHANIFQFLTLSFVLPFKALIITVKELSIGEYKTLLAQFRGFLSLFK